MPNSQSRRQALKNLATGALSAGALTSLSSFTSCDQKPTHANVLKNNIHHSACHWCYGSIPIEKFAPAAKKIGLVGVDLVGPAGWDALKQNGLISTMCNGAEINLVDGWNDKKFHDKLIQNYTDMIPRVAKAGWKNLICFSGSRRGIDDETGWNNCAEGLKKIMSLAEKNNVTLIMELLNSKVDHKDYQCDKTSWGVELCKRIGSPNFKLLYDIYHMQIDEGDVIRTIRDNFKYIGHFHTGGVPGRREIDDSQELYYPAIMRAIVALGYDGYVAQEFVPTAKEPEKQLDALAKAVAICDI
ncbi:MAG: TIM barrel protein [Chitinophagaceae bacterium]|nr:TIM barrel protein [Chitinophagaceae bacterium]